MLAAFTAGRIRAAIDLSSGAVVADPFEPTAALVELLRTRAAQICGERAAGRPLPRARRLPSPGRRPLQARSL